MEKSFLLLMLCDWKIRNSILSYFMSRQVGFSCLLNEIPFLLKMGMCGPCASPMRSRSSHPTSSHGRKRHGPAWLCPSKGKINQLIDRWIANKQALVFLTISFLLLIIFKCVSPHLAFETVCPTDVWNWWCDVLEISLSPFGSQQAWWGSELYTGLSHESFQNVFLPLTFLASSKEVRGPTPGLWL